MKNIIKNVGYTYIAPFGFKNPMKNNFDKFILKYDDLIVLVIYSIFNVLDKNIELEYLDVLSSAINLLYSVTDDNKNTGLRKEIKNPKKKYHFGKISKYMI